MTLAYTSAKKLPRATSSVPGQSAMRRLGRGRQSGPVLHARLPSHLPSKYVVSNRSSRACHDSSSKPMYLPSQQQDTSYLQRPLIEGQYSAQVLPFSPPLFSWHIPRPRARSLASQNKPFLASPLTCPSAPSCSRETIFFIISTPP